MPPPDQPARRPEPPPLKEAPRFEGLNKTFRSGEGQALAQASAVGLTFVVAIGLGLALGWKLDQKFGTAPWLLLLGLLIGIAAGFKNLFTLSSRLTRMEEARKKAGLEQKAGPAKPGPPSPGPPDD